MTSIEKPAMAITAFQIANGELSDLGARVEAHLQKMRAYEAKAQEKAGHDLRKADDHWNTVTQLLAEAKTTCDGGGFKAFKKKYCPDLSRSWIYELLAIGTGKTTVEELRAEKRASVAKSRSKKVSATLPVADSAVTPPVPYKPEIYLLNDTRNKFAELEPSLQPEPAVTAGSAEPKQKEPEAASAPPVTPPQSAEQIAKHPAEETASFICNTIRTALKTFSGDVPREIADCLITKHLDDLVEFARDQNFITVANAVVAKLNEITPSEQAALDNTTPAETSAEQMKMEVRRDRRSDHSPELMRVRRN